MGHANSVTKAGKDAHFKGVYSKKLFCTDPRHIDPRLQLWRDFTATADSNGTTTAASAV